MTKHACLVLYLIISCILVQINKYIPKKVFPTAIYVQTLTCKLQTPIIHPARSKYVFRHTYI